MRYKYMNSLQSNHENINEYISENSRNSSNLYDMINKQYTPNIQSQFNFQLNSQRKGSVNKSFPVLFDYDKKLVGVKNKSKHFWKSEYFWGDTLKSAIHSLKTTIQNTNGSVNKSFPILFDYDKKLVGVKNKSGYFWGDTLESAIDSLKTMIKNINGSVKSFPILFDYDQKLVGVKNKSEYFWGDTLESAIDSLIDSENKILYNKQQEMQRLKNKLSYLEGQIEYSKKRSNNYKKSNKISNVTKRNKIRNAEENEKKTVTLEDLKLKSIITKTEYNMNKIDSYLKSQSKMKTIDKNMNEIRRAKEWYNIAKKHRNDSILRVKAIKENAAKTRKQKIRNAENEEKMEKAKKAHANMIRISEENRLYKTRKLKERIEKKKTEKLKKICGWSKPWFGRPTMKHPRASNNCDTLPK